ncbi:MAG: restriction endonuclease subunit S [Candidatus Ureaplasma intestinipullorum]|uniref:Restriction endonuclease subunit S n=1 Tax=Candidatus Ureaplasma intestinipullorum TaxID=2838770 RepID=A0A9E2NW70_9BACT|nr:restriction endonuclease subunit S [Candidatus Ureaplasma intestinipullorum]
MSNLNNIIDQIQELIKNQKIEWKEIKDVANFYSGLKSKNKNDFKNGNKKYIQYNNIFKNNKIDMNNYVGYVKINSNDSQNIVQYNDILITCTSEKYDEIGATSIYLYNDEIYLNTFSKIIRINNENINNTFIMYLFHSKWFKNKLLKCTNGVTRFNLSFDKFKKIQIPIPPLETQNKIVEILDNFSNYETELETELETRTKQYNYYLNKLLDFSNNKEIEYKKLGDVSIFTNGYAFKKQDFLNEGEIPIIKITNIKNGQVDIAKTQFSNFDINSFSKFIIEKNDILIAMSGATVGKVGIYSDLKISFLNQRVGKIKSKENILNNKFLYYFLRMNENEILNLCKIGGAQPNINMNKLNFIKIPIPPLETQNKIVEILDNFNSLVNDIKDGLPKEIQLRKKQYNYYLNKLLDFKENK